MKNKILPMIFLVSIFGLIGCLFKSKPKKENLESWLEKNFPGQFQIDRNVRDIAPRHFFEKKVNAIVSDKQDPEVQLELIWYKDQPELGLNAEEVLTVFEARKKEKAQATDWFSKLKNAGLEKFSAGVIEQALYILPFGEPTPEARKQALEKILSALKNNPGEQTSIWVEWMEDSVYHQEFQDIIPYGYWRRKDGFHGYQNIMTLDFEWKESLTVDILNTGWAFNGKSNRCMEYMKLAYPTARTWAEEHGEKNHYLEPINMASYEVEEDAPLNVFFAYPVYEIQPDTTAGSTPEPLKYIRGRFNTDTRVFNKIEKVKEL